QPRPGEDVSILAGMLRVILAEDLYDHDFVADNVSGLDALRRAVEPFTPARVGARADVGADELVRAARIFANGRRGVAVAGTGPNMSGPATLVEYLILDLNSLCGRWLRAGDRVPAPFTVLASRAAKAQARPPSPAYGLGAPLPGSGLTGSAGGLPTGVFPYSVLHDGSDRIRALISCAGNPATAWPDQLLAIEAMSALELLVQIDIKMSATARLAHYVVAPRMSLETPGVTINVERSSQYAP